MNEMDTMEQAVAPKAQENAFVRWLRRPYAPSAHRIPELNGLRVLLVFIVSWYHFWQQSWLTPHVGSYSLDFLVRAGYVPVDGTILLSGFLLFLPHARAMLLGEPVPGVRGFYQKRVMRIVPSYYFVTFLMLFSIALPGLWSNVSQGPVASFGERMAWISQTYQGDVLRYLRDWFGGLTDAYGGDAGRMWEDILRHLTFTQTFDYATYVATPIGVASWTIAIEMQAYLIFPLLARCARRNPLATFGMMAAAAMCFRSWSIWAMEDYNMVVNQLPNFLDVYAIGMAAALVYVKLTTLWPRDRVVQTLLSVMATLVLILAIWGLAQLLRAHAGSSGTYGIQGGQMIRRPLFAALIAAVALALPFALRPIRFLMGNPLMGFLAMVSMNYYLIHQNLAVFLKQRLQLPPAANYPYPNSISYGPEQPWADQYTAMCFGLSLLAATLITFLIEKPGAWLLRKGFAFLNSLTDDLVAKLRRAVAPRTATLPDVPSPSNDLNKEDLP